MNHAVATSPLGNDENAGFTGARWRLWWTIGPSIGYIDSYTPVSPAVFKVPIFFISRYRRIISSEEVVPYTELISLSALGSRESASELVYLAPNCDRAVATILLAPPHEPRWRRDDKPTQAWLLASTVVVSAPPSPRCVPLETTFCTRTDDTPKGSRVVAPQGFHFASDPSSVRHVICFPVGSLPCSCPRCEYPEPADAYLDGVCCVDCGQDGCLTST